MGRVNPLDKTLREKEERERQEREKEQNELDPQNEEAGTAPEIVEVQTAATSLPSVLQDSGSKKKFKKENIGIYFEPDVAKVIKRQQEKHGKGWKSNFINDVVRWAFEQKGWLEPKEKGE